MTTKTRTIWLLLALFASASCQRQPTPEEKELAEIQARSRKLQDEILDARFEREYNEEMMRMLADAYDVLPIVDKDIGRRIARDIDECNAPPEGRTPVQRMQKLRDTHKRIQAEMARSH